MNNYCIYIKKRKNKPFCCLKQNEISFSQCRECDNKKYKNRKNVKIHTLENKNFVKNSTFYKSNNNQIRKNAQLQEKKSPKSAKMRKKSNKLAKLERKRYSVFTDDLEVCILCGRPKEHIHEIIYGKNRLNSIKYNFVIPLCANHHTGKDGIHFSKELDLYYKRLCQIYFENNLGDRTDFIKIFGRSYL